MEHLNKQKSLQHFAAEYVAKAPKAPKRLASETGMPESKPEPASKPKPKRLPKAPSPQFLERLNEPLTFVKDKDS